MHKMIYTHTYADLSRPWLSQAGSAEALEPGFTLLIIISSSSSSSIIVIVVVLVVVAAEAVVAVVVVVL